MKKLLLTLIISFIFLFSYGQNIEKLNYCNCIDKVEQLKSVLEGKYERLCDGKIIEQGLFENGKKEGEWLTYNKKGVLIKRINYFKGQPNGKWELYYVNGTPKLTAFFHMGEKIGKWVYFTSKGKIFITGDYELGKPINTWTINDKKGKTPTIQYDFNSAKYFNNQLIELHKDNDIIQNDNTGEYYILRYPKRSLIDGTSPLGGLNLSSDLFVDLMEIPLDYWDTYTNYKYKAKFNTSLENKTSVTLEPIAGHMGDNVPIYPFIVKTNDDNKLKKVNHSDLSIQLLEFKILETLNLLPPWIYTDRQETEIYIPYVINQIIGY